MSKAQYAQRHDGRVAALQYLYAWSINPPDNPVDDLRIFFEGQEQPRDHYSFGEEIIDGVIRNQVEIDAQIKVLAQNWEFDRIAKIDLAILQDRDVRDAPPEGHPAGGVHQRGDRHLQAVLERRLQALHQRHPRPPQGPARPGFSQGIRLGSGSAPRAVFSLFKKFKEGLAKTVSAISSKTHGIFGGRAIDASSLASLEEALFAADFGVETTAEILREIKSATRTDRALEGREAAAIGAEVLRRALTGSEGAVARAASGPTVIVLIGVNGSGKTTTAAKLAWRLKQEGGSVLLAACDTFRAAATEQLQSWATRLGLEIVSNKSGADPASVAFDAVQAARSRGARLGHHRYRRPPSHQGQPDGGALEDP